jgi:hypothetical protein
LALRRAEVDLKWRFKNVKQKRTCRHPDQKDATFPAQMAPTLDTRIGGFGRVRLRHESDEFKRSGNCCSQLGARSIGNAIG